MARDGAIWVGLLLAWFFFLTVFRRLDSVQELEGLWADFPTVFFRAGFSLRTSSSLCLPTSCLCSFGLYLGDGVGGTGSQATHVLPTFNEEVPIFPPVGTPRVFHNPVE